MRRELKALARPYIMDLYVVDGTLATGESLGGSAQELGALRAPGRRSAGPAAIHRC